MSPNPPSTPWWSSRWFLAALLLLLTVAVYAPGLRAGYLWDDDVYLTANPYLGTLSGLSDMWFRIGTTTMYVPMVFTTFWVEHHLWGLNPLGYHLVNLAFHAASVVLLWVLLRRLSVRGAWLAAALFAAHPVMVESIVWVTELKNVQSGFFCLLVLLAFLRWQPLDDGAAGPRGARRDYVLSLVFFAAALLSKPVVVAMAPAILVLIWWKRGRIRRADLLAVAPMFAMGLAAGFVAMYVERQFGGASGSAWQLGWIERVLVAGRAVWFYAAALLWPAGLLPIYPRWDVQASSWWQYLFPVGALAVLAVLWRLRHRIGRGPLAAVTCFGLMVSPLVGIFNVSYHLYSFVADHFQYHAAPALFALVGSGVAAVRRRFGGRALAHAASGAAIVVVLVLAVIAQRQTQAFRNERARCEATLAGNPACWVAMNNLGVALNAEGKSRDAVEWYQRALTVRPVYPEAHNNMGVALLALGDVSGAIRHYDEALRLWPGYALAHNNRATALARSGHTDAAVQAYREALVLNPESAEAHSNVAKVLASAGRIDEALREHREALRLDPRNADAHHALGVTLAGAGRCQEAIEEYGTALRISPDDAEVLTDLGSAFACAGNLPAATSEYRASLQIQPKNARAHNGLGLAEAWSGQTEAAAREFQVSLRIDPEYADAHNNYGTLLASQGDLDEAIPQFREAVRLKPGYAEAHGNLGAALAATGDLAEALVELREAARLAPESAVAHKRLGIALAEADRFDEAVIRLQRAVELDPSDEGARRNLDQVRRLHTAAPVR